MSDIRGSTDSAQSINWAKKAIRDCSERHELCRITETPALPTRILDIGTSESESHIFSIKLVEGNGRQGKYTCLSHCWGGKPPITTVRANIDHHKTEILLSALPKTFSDAVVFTYRLGIRYLWIDSLCIVQDDRDDWQRESARMASIYSNSVACIGATMSEGSHGGCFQKQPVRVESFRSSDYHHIDDQGEWEVHVRLPLDHGALSDGTIDTRFNIANHSSAPLLTRAWVFQERLLSPRFLQFLDSEILMECREGEDCQCQCQRGLVLGSGPTKSELSRGLATGELASIALLWHRIVMAYNALCMTFLTDRLAAIQGLATHCGRYRKGKYCAGLWEDSIYEDLAWQSWNPGGHNTLPRPNDRVAPTWSWASVNSKILYLFCVPEVRRIHCQVLSSFNTTAGSEKDEILVLSGPVTEGTLEYKGNGLTAEFQRPDAVRNIHIYADYPLGTPGRNYVPSGQKIFCLKFCTILIVERVPGHLLSLVLRKVGTEPDTFERIGILRQSTDPARADSKPIYDDASNVAVVRIR
ncbi:HET-domain-containing protein [Thozetella sp. PMI_491]|nr:HET-domain-containing protein [Thozetella sp. PMI_491]